MEGLRERKKRETQEAIAGVAMELFRERGFDAVTVADIARAADVAEKTVFNHFPTKEDLIFVRADDLLAAQVEEIRSRPPGTPLTTLFEAKTMRLLDQIDAGQMDRMRVVIGLVRESATLRGRLLVLFEHEANEVTAALDADDDVVAAVAIRALIGAHRTIFRAAMARLLTGEHPAKVTGELRIETRRVYSRLERGLAGFGT